MAMFVGNHFVWFGLLLICTSPMDNGQWASDPNTMSMAQSDPSVNQSVGASNVTRLEMLSCLLAMFFTALHCMHAVFPMARCLSVRPTVCLSITRVNCDKTNESSADFLTPYERKFI